MSCCLGALGRCSSPRITCVMPMSRSSTAAGPIRLEVGTLIAPGTDADPVQSVDDALGPFGTVALLVGVLDPEHEGAILLLGDSPVEERRARASNVEEPRR